MILVILQLLYLVITMGVFQTPTTQLTTDAELQRVIDSLKNQSLKKDTLHIYPFNPNYITDYKGYVLGMSTSEIDRLIAFRQKDLYVNSAVEFQKVTQVSDSLLELISGYFKFPDWTKKSAVQSDTSIQGANLAKKESTESTIVVQDLNTATALELQKVKGVGEKLSARILKFRASLGGFLVNEQLYDVYGLDVEVANRLLTYFEVQHEPSVTLVNINTATAYEISKIVYIKYGLAKNIVAYRDKNGGFVSFSDLLDVPEFPAKKIDRIKLYLTLD
ncbi:helix-hairpin-helix domain-containing protein [Cellulophaga sp. F20128]|uniref:ComEA family DNA-binding protein n=1 Tax=Cellulophaga sp. F20128 TaxID=2926413 RepID=UPI001FF173E3|nr:helix-hairpin-helix domain-containing protein [Cellulophaga sp. F20128]MCK0158402.1 helix-hairpin-helix domain-containing protein [Cellulophaga sp. F20128]